MPSPIAEPQMSPSVSVIIPSLNGADGVRRCLRALERQTIRTSLEIIVVDDGSTDNTGEAAAEHPVVLVRHAENRGVSAARNSGMGVASAPVVAFLDDDCEPCPTWAEILAAGYDFDVVAIGGSLVPVAGRGILHGYLARHNPLGPQELDLASSTSIVYRFRLYLRRQWATGPRSGRRRVVSVPSANMSVRRSALMAIGGFDERIIFGSEDEDLCRRLAVAYPAMRLIFDPEAQVLHHFKPSLRAMMKRRRAYGRGSAIMYHKWPDVPPILFPFPVAILAILATSFWFPGLLGLIPLIPHAFYPSGLRTAIKDRTPAPLVDAYLQIAEEAADNVGFINGLWRYRQFRADRSNGNTSGAVLGQD
jgi:glycosyltransferase involved in cell wall biosynthesis